MLDFRAVSNSVSRDVRRASAAHGRVSSSGCTTFRASQCTTGSLCRSQRLTSPAVVGSTTVTAPPVALTLFHNVDDECAPPGTSICLTAFAQCANYLSSKTTLFLKSRQEIDDPERPMKRCCQCQRPFGLVRQRIGFKQFCSKRCVQRYQADTERRISRLKGWTDFLSRKT